MSSVQIGDTIATSGYYDIQDGYGAIFNVRQKEANEYIDSVFRYELLGNLVADMVIQNGTIRIEQLGAIHHGMPIETTLLMGGNDHAVSDKNDTVFLRAIEHASINKIVLAEKAVYDFPYSYIHNKSNLIFEGNGATLAQLDDNEQPCLRIASSSVAIRNLNLINNSTGNTIAAIESFSSKLTLQNISIKSEESGLRLTGQAALNQVFADRIIIQAGSVGIQLEDTSHSELSNIRIHAGTTGFVLYGPSNNVSCRRMNIQSNTKGLDIHSTSASLFSDITLTGMNKALICVSSSNIRFYNILATQIKYGFSLSGCDNIVFANNHFCSKEPNGTTSTDLLFDSPYNCDNIDFVNCSFDFARKWFSVTNSNSNQANFRFLNCTFNARELLENEPYPAYIQYGTVNAEFFDCVFRVQNYPWLDEDLNAGTPAMVEPESAMFYFYIISSTTPVHTWQFDNCLFLHGTADANNQPTSVNSPFWIDAEGDEYERSTVYLKRCSLHNFRWTLRIFSDMYENNIDPAATGYPTEAEIDTAANALTNKQRFISEGNMYVHYSIPSGQVTHYQRCEEYGITA